MSRSRNRYYLEHDGDDDQARIEAYGPGGWWNVRDRERDDDVVFTSESRKEAEGVRAALADEERSEGEDG